MTGLNYPDDLYADALANPARVQDVAASTAHGHDAPFDMPASERKLRTALAYVNYARDLIRDALGDNDPKAQREAKIAYDVACDGKLGCGMLIKGDEGAVHLNINRLSERVPKWDVRWGKDVTVSDGLQWDSAPPNCLHPMHAETLRDHDERLNGAEDKL